MQTRWTARMFWWYSTNCASCRDRLEKGRIFTQLDVPSLFSTTLVLITLFTLSLFIDPLFLNSPAIAQSKSLVWERFDVDIDVLANGDIYVCEYQSIRFTEGTFTFGYRDLPKRYYSSADDWLVTDTTGRAYVPSLAGDEPYTFTIDESRSGYEIRWYFAPMANAAERYTICYTVHDALRYYEGGDQIWWKAIYGDRSFPVLDGQVRVNVPDGTQILEWAAYVNESDAREMATAQLLDGNQTAVFDLTDRLNGGREFEVRVQFTHGAVAGTVQPWQERADREAAEREAELAYFAKWGPIAALGFGAFGFLMLLGGPASLYALWYRFGRDKPVEMVADYLPEPPDSLPPGLVGTLLDEKADMEDILATLVDLARRKRISITEERTEGFLSSSNDYIYRKERDDVELHFYEEQLLRYVFGSKDEVRLSDLKNQFYVQLPKIKAALYEAAVSEGLFPSSPDATRSTYGFLAIAMVVMAAVSGFFLLSAFGELTTLAVFPAIGLGITALGMLILSRHMPKKTDAGSEAAARWNAFRNYLKNIDKYSDLEAQKEIWDQWLPYAIAFGFEKQYIRRFEQVDAPAPGWYFPSSQEYGPHRRRYYGHPWVLPTIGSGTVGGGAMPSGSPMPSSGEGRGAGGGLSDMSQGLGGGLSAMSAGLGSMLSSASSTMTSRPVSTSSSSGWSSGSSGGWSGGGGGFSGGGSFGGGGGGGGGGGFG